MRHIHTIKQRPGVATLAGALALSLSCGAAIAEAASPAITGTTATQAPALTSSPSASAHDVRASKLMGRDVRDVQGKAIGEVQELIVDIGTDRIQYVVLSFGGVMGVGDKLFAFPVSSLRKPHASGDLTLAVTKASLQKAPGFDRTRWPDFSDKTYREEIDRYFGARASGAPARDPDQRLARVSQIIGKDINDMAGKDAGEVEDIVVDLGAGKVRYVVIDFDKAWSPDDKLVALPLKALRFPAKTDDDLVLNVSREHLAAAKGFDEKDWPDINAATWRDDVDRYIERFPSAAGQSPAK